MSKTKKVIIIGAGFSSLSASCYLAKMGYEVHVLEKNETCGGRARQLKRGGFTFDIGPTFYWMPGVFESFFKDFGKSVSEYYALQRLDPAYRVYFDTLDWIDIGGNFDAIVNTFESIEKGSGEKLKTFIAKAGSNYDLTMGDLVYNPGQNIWEIITLKSAVKLHLFFDTIKNQVRRKFKNPRLRKILEFPVLFLGAKSSNTPAFYNFMNYADFSLGTWHPEGGMYSVVEAMVSLAEQLGVKIHTHTPVQDIDIEDGRIKRVNTTKGNFDCDILLSGADYHHTESLLPTQYRQYAPDYWSKKTFAPSALLFYIAINKRIENVAHHTLFFDSDFDAHQATIYDSKTWPEDPLFYASFPSKTDKSCAPTNCEAGIFLVPLAPGMQDDEQIRELCLDKILSRFERLTHCSIKEHIIFKESFGINDFVSAYNSYKGNAYGLANTLLQTHMLRPKLKSKRLKNLYFCGQMTVPGPGVPPTIISGKIVSQLISKYHNEGTI